jgi:hypothetical protein
MQLARASSKSTLSKDEGLCGIPSQARLYLIDAPFLTAAMRAAGLALPHEVPKLSVQAVISKQDYAELLDARLKRAKANGMLPRDNLVIEHQAALNGQLRRRV